MAEHDTIQALLLKTKSSDIDVKIDGVTKFQREFEANPPIHDIDDVISALRACLRISNQHLSTPTLSAIQALFSALAHSLTTNESLDQSTASASGDPHTSANLRQAATVFLAPGGGIIDRLGEPRESARNIARDTLVTIGAIALKTNGSPVGSSIRGKDKGPETLWSIFERSLREQGFTSKISRVREQTILTLVSIRQLSNMFPLRPFVPFLVEALEDSDGTVRDCARQSVITLFSDAVDNARADLKNEMLKKGVRKGIMEGILSGLLASSNSSTSSEITSSTILGELPAGEETNGASTRPTGASRTLSKPPIERRLPTTRTASGSGPPPMAEFAEGAVAPSAATVVTPIFIASARDLEQEFAKMLPCFEGKETEHNWADRERSVNRMRGMIKGDVHLRYPDAFLAGIRLLLDKTFAPLASLRTTVASNTCSFYSELADAITSSLDPFVESLLNQLLRMAGFTKKITAAQSQASVKSIITRTSCQPRIVLPLLLSFMSEKTAQARQYILGHVYTFLEVHARESKHLLESHSGAALDLLDKIIRKGLMDTTPGVKTKAREAFWLFATEWPAISGPIMDSLDSTARRQLEKANPNPSSVGTTTSAPAATKKSSVAAAIAASRAKAKAIKEAPPTLRHAATSGASAALKAHAIGLGSPPNSSPSTSRRTSSGPSSPPNGSMARRSTSPALASGRRSLTTSPVGRTPNSASPSPPPSPTIDITNRRKSALSPLSAAANHPLTASSSHTQSSNGTTRNYPSSKPLANPLPPRVPLPLPRDSLALFNHTAGNDVSLLMAIQNPLPEDSDDDDVGGGIFGKLRAAAAEDPTMEELLAQEEDPSLTPRERVVNGGTTRTIHSPAPSGTPSSSAASSHLMTLYPDDSISHQASRIMGSSTSSAPLIPRIQQNGEHELDPQHEFLVEEALRAAAEQAESSAERLKELMDTDGGTPANSPPTGSSLLPSSQHFTNGSGRTTIRASSSSARAPKTPIVHATVKKVPTHMTLFQDSPAVKKTPSVMDHLYENKALTGWWLKRKSLLDAGTPLKADSTTQGQELRSYIKAIQDGDASVRVMQKLILLCNANPAIGEDDLSPTQPLLPSLMKNVNGAALPGDIWEGGKRFDELFDTLDTFMRGTKDAELIEYALCVLWEMVENQTAYLDEAKVFSLLFVVRYANTHPILEATNTVRDALVSRQEPVYGLKTLHGCLLAFLKAPLPPASSSTSEETLAYVKTSSHAFGIIGLGKLIMRLPSEILEDELPILRETLVSVLDEKDPSRTTIREAAYASIVAAQSVLRDETRLFSLLDGLEVSKKNLLTYYFDKHGARGVVEGMGRGSNGEVQGEGKVVKELLRLDVKISTPVKR